MADRESNMKALISGSFDPITNGHLDIIKRAAAIFDEVTVGVFINAQKEYFFDISERVALVSEAVKALSNVKVDHSDGYVAKYVEENKIDVIVKGVRNAVDFEYEAKIDKVNKQIYAGAETLLLIASKETEELSSTYVKNKFSLGEDISELVPECVCKAFLKRK